MTKVLREDIIPRLNREVSCQATAEELEADPLLHRYMPVFDRECYSVDFFCFPEEQRISFCTYRKNVKEYWPDEWFSDYETTNDNGEKEVISPAERSVVLHAPKEKGMPEKSITLREIRKRSSSGHQTAIITTNKKLRLVKIAILMFAGWCQENFFKYMLESFGINSITSYFKGVLPDTSMVPNPEYRLTEKRQKENSALLSKYKVKYAEMSLYDKELSEKKMEKHIQTKAALKQDIEVPEEKRKYYIAKKKRVDKKIIFADLNENQTLNTSVNERKFFLDTLKIIAYRAETALVNLIKKQMSNSEKARSLIRSFYQANANISVDNDKNILFVKIHRTAHWADDKMLEYLCEELNNTKTCFPSTKLTLFFDLVS
jgi:hypothetical protein